MRRFTLFATAAAAAFALAAVPALAAPPTFDSAQGAGSIAPGVCAEPGVASVAQFCVGQNGRYFSFSAKQLGFGERAAGYYEQASSPLATAGSPVKGEVTCLNALGNFASFGGVITQHPNPDLVGAPFVVYVVDNGPAGSVPPDLISPLGVFPQGDADRALLPEGFPNVCPPPAPSLYGYFPVSEGNIVVDDESAPGLTMP